MIPAKSTHSCIKCGVYSYRQYKMKKTNMDLCNIHPLSRYNGKIASHSAFKGLDLLFFYWPKLSVVHHKVMQPQPFGPCRRRCISRKWAVSCGIVHRSSLTIDDQSKRLAHGRLTYTSKTHCLEELIPWYLWYFFWIVFLINSPAMGLTNSNLEYFCGGTTIPNLVPFRPHRSSQSLISSCCLLWGGSTSTTSANIEPLIITSGGSLPCSKEVTLICLQAAHLRATQASRFLCPLFPKKRIILDRSLKMQRIWFRASASFWTEPEISQ